MGFGCRSVEERFKVVKVEEHSGVQELNAIELNCAILYQASTLTKY